MGFDIEGSITFPKFEFEYRKGEKKKFQKWVQSIPLHPMLLELLSPMKSSGYIVGDGVTPISDMAFKRAMERIEKEINIHDATAHVFRHTYLTLLAGTGIDVKTLQSIGGHSDIQTTLNRYVHPMQEYILDAGKRMTSFITGN